MRMFHRSRKVEDRQEYEYKGLDNRDEDTQAKDGQRREVGPGQQEKNSKQGLFCHNITEQPDGK